jgi:hypothetical protein
MTLLVAALCFLYGAWLMVRPAPVEGLALWVVGMATLGRYHWLAYVVSFALLVVAFYVRRRNPAAK